jgi:agmatinase
VQKTRFSRKQVDLIMLSKLALVSLIGVSGTYSSIVPVEQKPLMLQCEPVDMAGRNALVNSRSGKDVSGKSFLDRYYGSFFDNIQV